MEIPHERLKPETLRSLVEEFITREGTDYGETEFSLEQKVAQVLAQLKQRKAVIVMDETTETFSIIVKG